VETVFRERLRLDAVAGTWRLVEGDTARLVATHARYADLTILGQQDPDSGEPFRSEIVDEVLFSSGRPLLIIPFAGKFLPAGSKALVGWNARRGGTRRERRPAAAGAGGFDDGRHRGFGRQHRRPE